MFLAVSPLTLLYPLSLLIGLILLVLGLMRLKRNWKNGLTLIAVALLLQSWWMIAIAWFFLTPDYANYGIKAETRQ